MSDTPAPAVTETTSPAQSAQAGSNLVTTPSTPPPAQAPAALPEMYELKVNGRSIKVTKEELIKRAQLSEAANEKFDQAAKANKAVERILSTAKSNPIAALIEAGLTKDQIKDAMERWYTEEYIEPETLPPEQLKLKQAEARLKKYEEQEKAEREKREREEQDKLTETQRSYLQDQIVQAIEQSGLPKTKFIASRVAFYMRENLVNGWDAPVDLIIQQVKKERAAQYSHEVETLDGEALINLLGEGVVKKIREHDLKQLRERRGIKRTESQADTSQPAEKISMSDVNRNLRNMRLGRPIK